MKFPKKHIRTVFGVLCSMIALMPLQGQELWPGDVSGNGLVDHQDVLFWAYARGAEGASRQNANTDFQPQSVDLTDWTGVFPATDRSFAYADCNGDGKVDYADRLVIEQNYYQAVAGPVLPDPFQMGDGPIGSQLVLGENASIDIVAGEETAIPFSLATQEMQPIELGYLGFQLSYGTELIAEGPNGELLFNISFDVDGNDWFMEAQDGVEFFIHHHENLGFSDLALYMSSPGDYVVGNGAIAEFTIVVEEVVFGLHDINIDVPVILDADFKRPGFVSGQGITLNLVGKPVSTDGQALPAGALTVFPNPVNTGILHAQLERNHPGIIEQMELFDQTGRLITSHAPNARAGQLNARFLPEGLYVLKIITDAGTQTMQVKATR
ncbi:MAG: T9SS type A sorting domain-containing protein [Phaeodactylibacter sp.]|uniref:T9SS type A sorting domain-containing protein n=1 Tax=Phaeodactylibacter sp. TaxID=1940289 RepID=UPI0032EBC899